MDDWEKIDDLLRLNHGQRKVTQDVIGSLWLAPLGSEFFDLSPLTNRPAHADHRPEESLPEVTPTSSAALVE
jgi:hypothetical protein